MHYTRDDRRDQVVSAVLALIGERGMIGFTTSAVARKVGMSEANLYRHFKNKQEILSETIARIGEGLNSNVDAAANFPGTPIDRLKNIFRLHLRYIGHYNGIPKIIFSDEMCAQNAELKMKLLHIISNYTELLEGIVSEGIEKGLLRDELDSKAVALTFIGMIQITILRWTLSGFTLALEEETLMLWSNFETFLRPHDCLIEKGRKSHKC